MQRRLRYFRTSHEGYEKAGEGYGWEYSSMQISKNAPDEVRVTMYTNNDAARYFEPQERGLVRNEDGHWVLTSA